MKKTFFAIIASIAMAFGFATTASAQCVAGCETVVTTTTNSPPPPVPTMSYTAAVQAINSGSAGAAFEGEKGFALANKIGYSGVDITLNAGGNLCGNLCGDGNYGVKAYGGEHTKSEAAALTTTSGKSATVVNFGAAYSAINLSFQKPLNGAP